MRECSKKTSSKEKEVDELIHQIIYNEWTKKNIQKYKTILPSIMSSRRNQSLITTSISTDSTRNSSNYIAWYVEIAEDHETLNISESETWSQLSAAHCDLVFDLSSFFTHHNMFDAPHIHFQLLFSLLIWVQYLTHYLIMFTESTSLLCLICVIC
jgi:hypothetical protein